MVLNPILNSGPLFYIQDRMGKDCKLFRVIKFRSMSQTDKVLRTHTDPIEHDRITTLGHFIRKIRLDELPQIINIIKGDMSLIGPRPDYYMHAQEFLLCVDGYRLRHKLRPGITGLSQIRLGYAEGIQETQLKSDIDNYYIENISFLLEIKILFGTIIVILRGGGN